MMDGAPTVERQPSRAEILARASELPDPHHAPADAPLAVGDDLSVVTLLAAYRRGLFPWPADGAVWWWSPHPRAVLPLDQLHVPRSVRPVLRRLAITVDREFDAVVDGCADRPGQGTWITPPMRSAYQSLHRLGHAHSVEVWDGARLVGGLYGVAVGAAFSGESMFHRVSDASKVALVATVLRLRAGGFTLFDVQQDTDHLRRFGARPMPRAAFLAALGAAVDRPARLVRTAAPEPAVPAAPS